MRRTLRIVQPRGTAVFRRPDGSAVEIPVVQGILKHGTRPRGVGRCVHL